MAAAREGVATLRHVSYTQWEVHMRRLFITLLAVAAAALILFAPVGTAEDATNDVPFDLESGIGLAFIGGLQVFNLYWDNNWNDAGHNDGLLDRKHRRCDEGAR